MLLPQLHVPNWLYWCLSRSKSLVQLLDLLLHMLQGPSRRSAAAHRPEAVFSARKWAPAAAVFGFSGACLFVELHMPA
jgi:hypothetical protein